MKKTLLPKILPAYHGVKRDIAKRFNSSQKLGETITVAYVGQCMNGYVNNPTSRKIRHTAITQFGCVEVKS